MWSCYYMQETTLWSGSESLRSQVSGVELCCPSKIQYCFNYWNILRSVYETQLTSHASQLLWTMNGTDCTWHCCGQRWVHIVVTATVSECCIIAQCTAQPWTRVTNATTAADIPNTVLFAFGHRDTIDLPPTPICLLVAERSKSKLTSCSFASNTTPRQ